MEHQLSSKQGSVLVTGGAGFIGSHVVDDLIARGYSVVVLDDLSGGFRENVHKDATFVQGSVNDIPLVEQLFAQHSFRYVFHLAAYAAEGLSHFIRGFNYTNNVLGSINLINASIKSGVRCFVFTSSIAVYGKNQVPMHEGLTPQPEDPYGIAKYAVELDLEAAHRMFGLNYIIFRPHNVYGERQNIGDKYRNVLGIFMNNLMRGEALPIFGDGKQERAFTHIADVAPVIAGSVEQENAYNQVFNVGADVPYSVNDLVKVIEAGMGMKANIKYLPPRNEVKIAYSDHAKARELLHAHASVSLEEGVARMAKWVKATGIRESTKFRAIEITQNLPPSWLE